MNLVCLTIWQWCNYDCPYCIFKKYMNNNNTLTASIVLEYFDKWFKPSETHIKITGGEPSLHPEINSLITELSARGYKGIIETNGSLPLVWSDNFIRLAAWHLNRPMPLYWDKMLLIDNPEDEFLEDKKSIVPEHILVPLRGQGADGHAIDATHEKTKYEYMTMIWNDGTMAGCPILETRQNIRDMSEPLWSNMMTCHCAQTFIMDQLVYDN